MRRTLLIVYLLVIHAIVIGLLWRSDAGAKWRGLADSSTARILEAQHRKDWTVPEGAPVFLGDSITAGLAAVAVEPRAVNFAIGGQTSTDLLHRLPASLPRAGKVYLMIGVNDLLRGEREALNANLPRILAALPDVPLVWTGVMRDDPINARIRALCAKRPQCRYVEPPTDPALFVDGVHLNAAGYREWVIRLRQSRR